MTNYVCKYCGRASADAAFAGTVCNKSPNRHLELLRAQDRYACRYCGRTGSNPSFAGCSCNKSPTRLCVLVG
jgi:DNA-directed RNA polymerase subunit RPC12/RpoP